MRLLHRTLGLVVEPAGAAGIAALLEHPDRFRGREILTPLCGGNADPALLTGYRRMTASLREQVPLPGRSRVTGNGGAVTAMTAGAARAGAGILAAGGNAADAAVAAMLAAGVVEPAMNGLGGTAYAVVFEPESGRVTALDGQRAVSGSRAHEAMFEPLEGVGGGLYGFPPTRGDRAETGPLSVLVAHGSGDPRRDPPPVRPAPVRRRGRTRGAAGGGGVSFPIGSSRVHAAAGYRRLRLCPAAFALYTRGDGIPFVPLGEEDRLRNPELAGSLRVARRRGSRNPFYRGPIARRLLEVVNEAGGILSESDLEAAAVREVPPLDFGFRDVTAATLPATPGAPRWRRRFPTWMPFPP